jgi:luciferase family oxidoreductase group 1
MRLGLLDFCSLRKRQSPVERVFETVQLAQQAEHLGFSRYWLSEHHELNYAHHSPELLATILAGSTERIRVGVAGMLMLLHSPLRVAEAFRLMSGLFSGRVDLGMGSGLAEPSVIKELRQGVPISNMTEDYQQRVSRLMALMRGEGEPSFNPLDAPPCPLWVLGLSSPGTAAFAARQGACYGVSLSHNKSRDNPSLISVYRDEFRPTPTQPKPQWIVSVAGVCAETEQEARRLAEQTADNPRSGLEIVGTPQQCLEQLEAIRERYQCEELIHLDLAPDLESRRRSLQLLAEAVGLRT